MKKRVLSLVLTLAMVIGLLIPLGAISVSAETVKSITEYNQSDADGTVYTIGSASDLLAFRDAMTNGYAAQGASWNWGAGKVFRLTADIDLNPGWNGKVTVDTSAGTATYPSAPSTIWKDNSTRKLRGFRGTFDGQGHTIAGLYAAWSGGGDGDAGVFIDNLSGNVTIRNLSIVNSCIVVTSSGDRNEIGALIGYSNADSATIENVYVDADAWVVGKGYYYLGGLVAVHRDKTLTIRNSAFVGTLGTTNSGSNAYPGASANGGTKAGQLIGEVRKTGVTTSNIVLAGNIYTKSGTWDNVIKSNPSNATRTNIVVGKYASVSAASSASAITGYNAGSIAMTYSDYTGTILPTTVASIVPLKPITAADDNDVTGTIYAISTEDDLLTFAHLGADGNTFAKRTVILTNDIDLNPTWDASVTISETVQFPLIPAVTWPNIPAFNGTFDGRGYLISGIYTSKNVAGNTGAYGGLFNALNGTVKNLAIVNSFMLTSNSGDGGKAIHVGGIAGDVNAGALLQNVYLDAEIWFKSNNHCMLGGAFGFANGAYTVKGYAFVGRVGNTSAALATNYATADGKNIYIAEITACQNFKSTDIRNSLCGGTVYTGRNSASNRHLGVDISGWPLSFVLVGKQTSEWLESRSDYQSAGFVYNASVESAVPGEVVGLISGLSSIDAGTATNPSIQDYDGSRYIYAISSVADLLYAAQLSQSGVTFAGKILRLTADIDLNPGWDADVTITAGVATLPRVPTVIFPGFATFQGALDGAEHTISGVFMSRYIRNSSENLAFIEILTGSLRNLKFSNSFIFADMKDDSWSTSDCKIGGVIARANGDWSRIYNIYADINVWARTSAMQRMGGIAAKSSGSNTEYNNIVFAGTVGTIAPANNAVPGPDAAVYMSQIIGDGDWKGGLSLKNYAMNGTCYAKDGVITTNAIASNQSATVTAGTATVTAPSVSPVAGFALWPTAGTADSNTASVTDGQKEIRYYQSMTAEQFLTWTSSLESAGYALAQSYALDNNGNNSFMYQNGVYTVYASWLGAVGTARARVIVEPYGANYNTANTFASSTRVCDSQIWQLDVDNFYGGQHGGMGYVIRLTNGEFIVIDGGYSSADEADNLYAILSANNVLSGKPVIAGWFITHLHDDHFGGLIRFARLYNAKVTVKGFYASFPSETVGNITASGNIQFVIDHMARFAGAKVYEIHSGMKIGFADATATILATYEDVKQSYWNGSITSNNFYDANDTSTVVRFDVKDKTGSSTTKFMVLGDACSGLDKALRYTWTATELGANIVQIAHHGMNANSYDVSTALYQTIGASTYFWPAEIVTYDSSTHAARDLDADNSFHNLFTSHSRDVNVWIKSNAAEVIPAWENVCLTLPYTAGTYLDSTGIKDSNTVNTTTAYNRKLLMTNVATIDTCAAQQTAVAENETNIRFLATVSMDAGDISDLGSFGFDITMIYEGTVYHWTKEVHTIYTSVIAAGETVTATEINAGSNYIFAYVLNGVPAGTGETVEFKVSCFGTLTTGEQIASKAVATFTVTDGVLAAN